MCPAAPPSSSSLRVNSAGAMQGTSEAAVSPHYDFRRWFNDAERADVLLHIFCKKHVPANDASGDVTLVSPPPADDALQPPPDGDSGAPGGRSDAAASLGDAGMTPAQQERHAHTGQAHAAHADQPQPEAVPEEAASGRQGPTPAAGVASHAGGRGADCTQAGEPAINITKQGDADSAGSGSAPAGPSAGSSAAQQAEAEQADTSAPSTRKRQTAGACLSAAPAEKRVKGACPQIEVPQPDRTYHLHWIVLCAQSKYFEAMLSSTWQQQQQQQQIASASTIASACEDPYAPGTSQPSYAPGASQPSHQRQLIITLHQEEEDLPAMDMLLRLMYGHPISANAPSQLVWQCLKLADGLEAVPCIDLVLNHIHTKGLDADPVVLYQVRTVPDGVSARPAFAPLVKACKAIALQTFEKGTVSGDPAMWDACKRFVAFTYGDVPAVIRSARLRNEFCSLPFSAVLAWAESDELQVHSENCVVYLLNAWVTGLPRPPPQRATYGAYAAQPQTQGTSQQHEQLAHQVRVLHLGPAYQHHILPQLGWFKGCGGIAHLPTLLAFKGKDAAGNTVFPMPGVDFKESDQAWPKQWVAAPRRCSSETSTEHLLKWRVDAGQLQQLRQGRPLTSPPLCVNGFMLAMKADIRGSSSIGGGWSLALHTGVMAAQGISAYQAEASIPWVDTAAVILGPVCHRVPGGALELTLGTTARVGTRDVGVASDPARSVAELLERYIVDGKLRLEAQFSHVDRA